MNFAFWEFDASEVGVMLTCVVHKDNEHYFISFILDLMSKKSNRIDCERDADQPPSYSPTSGHRLGIGHFLTEDQVIEVKSK